MKNKSNTSTNSLKMMLPGNGLELETENFFNDGPDAISNLSQNIEDMTHKIKEY